LTLALPRARAASFHSPSRQVYEPFFADFGPLNMACAYRFCQRALAALEARVRRPCGANPDPNASLTRVLQEASQSRPPRKVFFCTTDDPHRKTNAAVLVGALSVMHLRRTVEDAYRQLLPLKPFAPFRDASCGPSTYHLTVLDCLRACPVVRAKAVHTSILTD
jgi:cell division cycle 14